GVLPHVAGAGRSSINYRFANLTVSGGQQHEDHFAPADVFPFAYAETTDHLTGRRDAILKRPDTDPLVIHTQTATEYWQRRGSLAHTDMRGNICRSPPAPASTCGRARNILPTLCSRARSAGCARTIATPWPH